MAFRFAHYNGAFKIVFGALAVGIILLLIAVIGPVFLGTGGAGQILMAVVPTIALICLLVAGLGLRILDLIAMAEVALSRNDNGWKLLNFLVLFFLGVIGLAIYWFITRKNLVTEEGKAGAGGNLGAGSAALFALAIFGVAVFTIVIVIAVLFFIGVLNPRPTHEIPLFSEEKLANISIASFKPHWAGAAINTTYEGGNGAYYYAKEAVTHSEAISVSAIAYKRVDSTYEDSSTTAARAYLHVKDKYYSGGDANSSLCEFSTPKVGILNATPQGDAVFAVSVYCQDAAYSTAGINLLCVHECFVRNNIAVAIGYCDTEPPAYNSTGMEARVGTMLAEIEDYAAEMDGKIYAAEPKLQ